MKCEFCKSDVPAESKFCPVCGAEIKRVEIPQNVTHESQKNEVILACVETVSKSIRESGGLKNIFLGEDIPHETLSRFKDFSKEETPLVLVNSDPALLIFGYTGILITKTRLHYVAQKKGARGTFFGSGEKVSGSISLKNHTFSIGKESSSYDGSYFGDEFYIDGKLRGWIRFDKMPWIRGWSPSRKGVSVISVLFSAINKINK